MSYHFRGRYTHDHAVYQRWKAEAEAQDALASANASRREAASLRQQLSQMGEQYESDVRAAARRQTRLEQQQRRYREIVDQVVHRQEAFERATIEREAELERELRDELGATEARLQEEINEARAESAQQIAAVRQEVGAVRSEMQQGLAAVDQRITAVRNDLQKQADALRGDLENERNARLAKEADRVKAAMALLDWVDAKAGTLRDADSLGLTIETVRMQESVRRAREVLAGTDKESALPIADDAYRIYQTAYVESERRKGVIEGVADHVDESVARLRSIIEEQAFTTLFDEEAERLRNAATALEKRANGWRAAFNWHAFENERKDTVAAANALVSAAVELQASISNLTARLHARDMKIDDIGAAVTELMGPADGFEAGFANPRDPKSPRLLRARVGHSTVDAYLHLDGGFDVEAYGFQSAGECQRMADRMNRKLREMWHLDAAEVRHDNPQAAALNVTAAPERWQTISHDINRVTSAMT